LSIIFLYLLAKIFPCSAVYFACRIYLDRWTYFPIHAWEEAGKNQIRTKCHQESIPCNLKSLKNGELFLGVDNQRNSRAFKIQSKKKALWDNLKEEILKSREIMPWPTPGRTTCFCTFDIETPMSNLMNFRHVLQPFVNCGENCSRSKVLVHLNLTIIQ